MQMAWDCEGQQGQRGTVWNREQSGGQRNCQQDTEDNTHVGHTTWAEGWLDHHGQQGMVDTRQARGRMGQTAGAPEVGTLLGEPHGGGEAADKLHGEGAMTTGQQAGRPLSSAPGSWPRPLSSQGPR